MWSNWNDHHSSLKISQKFMAWLSGVPPFHHVPVSWNHWPLRFEAIGDASMRETYAAACAAWQGRFTVNLPTRKDGRQQDGFFCDCLAKLHLGWDHKDYPGSSCLTMGVYGMYSNYYILFSKQLRLLSPRVMMVGTHWICSGSLQVFRRFNKAIVELPESTLTFLDQSPTCFDVSSPNT